MEEVLLMGNIFMRFPGGRKKALTLSYDDATRQDIRLIAIMKQYGLKGTFNVSTGILAPAGTVYQTGTIHQRMEKNELAEVYGKSGMEVAVHGHTHPYLDQLPMNLCLEEIERNRLELEAQFGTIVRGMAYPYGRYPDELVKLLPALGIAYARTTVSSGCFELPKDWLRLEATCHHKDGRLMELAEEFVEKEAKKAPWLFCLWGHSFEFDRDDNWDVIEQFASRVGSREEIWYATNLEIYDYVQAYGRLIYSMDGSRVCNPTDQRLYFEAGEQIWSVGSGEMVEIIPEVMGMPGLRVSN